MPKQMPSNPKSGFGNKSKGTLSFLGHRKYYNSTNTNSPSSQKIGGLNCLLLSAFCGNDKNIYLQIDAKSANCDHFVQLFINVPKYHNYQNYQNQYERTIANFICYKEKCNIFRIMCFKENYEQQQHVNTGELTVDVELTELLREQIRNPNCKFDEHVDNFTDLIFCIDDEEIHCNRQFMAFISPVFKEMLFGNYSEGKKNRVVLREIKAEDFKNMLSVVYPDHRPITNETVAGILEIANMYQIESVINKCDNFFTKSLNKPISQLLYMADKFSLPFLLEKCLCIAMNHDKAAEIVNSEYYPLLSLETKEKMLKNTFHGKKTRWQAYTEVNEDVYCDDYY